MKRSLRIIACLLVLSLTVTLLSVVSIAEDSSVVYEGGAESFVFIDDDDLFDNFKNLMPGDTVTQNITIKNNYSGMDHVNIYLRAELHDENSNPLSADVAQTETIDSMHAFLNQLSMKVWCGEDLIYSASPDELDGLANNVLIGSLANGEESQLRVELVIPTSLGNEFQYAKGEVDWVFTVSEVPGSANVSIWGNKYLDDETPNGNTFRFALLNQRGETVQIVSNSGHNVFFYPMELEYGTHIFTVHEINEGAEGIIYDPAVFKVYVTVDALGAADVRYVSGGSNLAWFVFNNYTDDAQEVYDPEEPGVETDDDSYVDTDDEDEAVKSEENEEDVTSPLTGDDTNIILWIVLLVLGLAAIVLVLVFDRKKKKSEN